MSAITKAVLLVLIPAIYLANCAHSRNLKENREFEAFSKVKKSEMVGRISPNLDCNTPRHYCGNKLLVAVQQVCNRPFANQQPSKRSSYTGSQLYSLYKRNLIVDECCKKRCNCTDLLKYCYPAAAERPTETNRLHNIHSTSTPAMNTERNLISIPQFSVGHDSVRVVDGLGNDWIRINPSSVSDQMQNVKPEPTQNIINLHGNLPRHYCGPELRKNLKRVCNSLLENQKPSKRSSYTGRQLYSLYKRDAIIDECCNKPCIDTDLVKYCHPRIAERPTETNRIHIHSTSRPAMNVPRRIESVEVEVYEKRTERNLICFPEFNDGHDSGRVVDTLNNHWIRVNHSSVSDQMSNVKPGQTQNIFLETTESETTQTANEEIVESNETPVESVALFGPEDTNAENNIATSNSRTVHSSLE